MCRARLNSLATKISESKSSQHIFEAINAVEMEEEKTDTVSTSSQTEEGRGKKKKANTHHTHQLSSSKIC